MYNEFSGSTPKSVLDIGHAKYFESLSLFTLALKNQATTNTTEQALICYQKYANKWR